MSSCEVSELSERRAFGLTSRSGVLLWLLGGTMLILLAAWCPLRLGVVSGSSMMPALRPYQPFVMDRSYYRSHPPQVGDIVVFRLEDQVYIKRIAAGPGETACIFEYLDDTARPAYSVFVYPDELSRVSRLTARYSQFCRLSSINIPRDGIYVVGDAWNVSDDSRHFGPISMDQVIGKVLMPRTRLPERDLWAHVDRLPQLSSH